MDTTRVRRTVSLMLATLVVALSTGLAAAPPAHAALSCSSGYACVYEDRGLSGIALVYRSAGNANPNVAVYGENGGFVWNHGQRCGGCDSLQVKTYYPTNGAHYTICLNYGENLAFADGSEPRPTAAFLSYGEVVQSWRWRSTCGSSPQDLYWIWTPS
jgi:hypothetical protein